MSREVKREQTHTLRRGDGDFINSPESSGEVVKSYYSWVSNSLPPTYYFFRNKI